MLRPIRWRFYAIRAGSLTLIVSSMTGASKADGWSPLIGPLNFDVPGVVYSEQEYFNFRPCPNCLPTDCVYEPYSTKTSTPHTGFVSIPLGEITAGNALIKRAPGTPYTGTEWIPSSRVFPTAISTWSYGSTGTSKRDVRYQLSSDGTLLVWETRVSSETSDAGRQTEIRVSEESSLNLNTGVYDIRFSWDQTGLGRNETAGFCTSDFNGEGRWTGRAKGQLSFWNSQFGGRIFWTQVSAPKHELSLIDPAKAGLLGTNVSSEQAVLNASADSTGISADGTSLGVIKFVTTASGPVSFDVSLDAAPASLLSPFVPGFVSGVISSGTSSMVVEPKAMPDGSGRYYVLALLRAPRQYPSTGLPVLKITALQQPSVPVEKFLLISAPPLVMIHGVWSNGTIWRAFEQYAKVRYPAASFNRVDYEPWNFKTYTSSENQMALTYGVVAALREAMNAGVIASQVDVVGHSMGNLITRAFAASPYYKNNRNYHQGYVNQLVSVGAPHTGSKIASWLLQNRTARFKPDSFVAGFPILKNLTLEGLTTKILGRIDTAIVDLQSAPGLAPPSVLPYAAIAGVSPTPTGTDTSVNLVRLFLDKALVASFDTTKNLDSIFNEQHDTIVELSSQLSDASATKVITGITHAGAGDLTALTPTETNSESVWNEIICYLRTTSFCSSAAARIDSAEVRSWSGPEAQAVSLAGKSEVDPSLMSVTPEETPGLELGQKTSVTVSSTAKTIVAVMFYLDGSGFVEDSSEPFRVDVTPSGLAVKMLDVIAVFDDNTFARKTYSYPVVAPANLVALVTYHPNMYFESVGLAAQIEPTAYFESATSDVRSTAAYSTRSGGTSVVSVSQGGVVTATAVGSDVVVVSYGGKTADIAVVVDAAPAPVRGFDPNGDGSVSVSDIFYLINHLFAGGPGPTANGEANGDGSVSASDIFYLINHLFAGGPAPQ